MGIYLGDLTVEQIETRLGVELSAEDKETLKASHQAAVNDTPIEHGKWHCFDIPFMLMTSDKETAKDFVKLFEKYDATTFKQCFQIGWEKEEQEHE